jgi:hypothetical protein
MSNCSQNLVAQASPGAKKSENKFHRKYYTIIAFYNASELQPPQRRPEPMAQAWLWPGQERLVDGLLWV